MILKGDVSPYVMRRAYEQLTTETIRERNRKEIHSAPEAFERTEAEDSCERRSDIILTTSTNQT